MSKSNQSFHGFWICTVKSSTLFCRCSLCSTSWFQILSLQMKAFSSHPNENYRADYITERDYSKKCCFSNTLCEFMSTLFHVDMKNTTAWYEQKRPRTRTSRSHSPTHRTGTVGQREFGAENGMVWYLLLFHWVPILAPTYSLPLRFDYLFTLRQRVAQEPKGT